MPHQVEADFLIFSIIIPCFNHDKYLARAVESILLHNQSRCEVIIVNDGSTDQTQSVALSMASNHNCVSVINKLNGGLSSARNAGMAQAKGEWLLFLDADDYLLPGSLDAAELFIAGNPCIDVFYSGHRIENSLGMTINESSGRDLPKNILEEVLYSNWMPVHAVFSRKSFYVDIGNFDEDLNACEDWDMWIRLAIGGAVFGHLKRICAVYVRYPDSMSSSYVRMVKSARKVLLKNRKSVGSDRILVGHIEKGLKNVRPWMFGWILSPILSSHIQKRNVFLLSKVIFENVRRDLPTVFLISTFFHTLVSSRALRLLR